MNLHLDSYKVTLKLTKNAPNNHTMNFMNCNMNSLPIMIIRIILEICPY